MKLDARLEAALDFIRADTHADIGSDHARLPIALVRSGRVQSVLIVEKTPGPVEVARASIVRAGLTAQIEVRLGDGFTPLEFGEVQSASLTGLGARTILGILKRAVWLPSQLVLQPNDTAAPLRAWAAENGYHLTGEALAPGFWTYGVLQLRQATGPDPAYVGLPPDLALTWGPHLLARRDPLLLAQLRAHEARLGRLNAPEKLAPVRRALRWLSAPASAPARATPAAACPHRWPR